jgi:hypothetical protein
MLVTHGKPFAQIYGIRDYWRKFNLTAIAGSDSPAHLVTEQDVRGSSLEATTPNDRISHDIQRIFSRGGTAFGRFN